MPLEAKVYLTRARITEFYTGYNTIGYGNAYISFSGGKDSTVLLDIARKMYPEIPAVFSNTGLEYPEIRRFAKAHDNVEVVQPKIPFNEVISRYGYPLIGKEVAEAIYYARKIRSQDVQVERERARGRASDSDERFTQPQNGTDGCVPAFYTHTHTQRKREDIVGERGTGVEVAEYSQFNKEKWFPLCYIPVMISHYCCQKIKKDPLNAYKRRTHRYPIMATMAEESRVRKQAWLRTGCNAFEGKIQSKPMSFWTEQDVLEYVVENGLEICSVYGDIVAVDEVGNEYDPHNLLIDGCKLKCTGCDRTGCIYCGFGAHLERGETRFQRLARTHPRQYEYCMGGGQWVDNPAYDPVAPEYDGEWKNWNPKQIWVPSKKGLGLKVVFDMANEIYGKDFLRYD